MITIAQTTPMRNEKQHILPNLTKNKQKKQRVKT